MYVNQHLLNCMQMVASDSDHIFFALCFTQKLKLQGQINIAMKNVCCGHLTVRWFITKFLRNSLVIYCQ